MSQLFNPAGAYVPVREARTSSGVLGSLGAEIVHQLDGDESVLIYLNGGGATFNATVDFFGSVDGTNFNIALPAWPIPQGFTGGTIAQAAQPMLLEAINTTSVQRVYSLRVAQLKAIRVRTVAWTAGAAGVTMVSDAQAALSLYVVEQKANSLFATATAAVGVAVTLTLPAVAGLRHYLDFIKVTRSATAALTASASPVLITTTNLPGAPVLTLGQDAGGIGVDRDVQFDFGSSGLAATALGTPTTIVCPAYVGVIWRASAAYRLGI
jgi:hypothetical protein